MTTNFTQQMREARDEAVADLASVQARIEELENVIRALDYMIRRDERRVQQETPRSEWGLMRRAAAIERVMRGEGQPLSPTEIADALHAQGRDDPANGVSATLARMKQDGKVESAGYGKWRLLPFSKPDTSAATSPNGLAREEAPLP